MAEEQGRRRRRKKRVNGDGRGAGEEKKREMEGRRSRQGGRNRREKEMEGRRRISVNPLQHDVIFFGAFFGLYVRCQFISGCKKHHLFAMTELKLFSI
jgi:hypothetical protein